MKISTFSKLLILFFVVNLILKLLFIHSTPPSATYDEVIYITEAQSIVKYGTDLTGNWRPWHLAPSDSYYTELTSTLLVPGFWLFPNDPILASKFVPIILGSLLPVLLGLIAYRFKPELRVLAFTSGIATLNPWIFQFSRMGYDSLFSVVFYCIGLVLVFYAKRWQKLWSIIPFFIGFYQYQGHKVLLVPMLVLVTFFIFFEKYSTIELRTKIKKIFQDKELQSTVVVLIFSVILTLFYLFRLPYLKSSERIGEFSFYDELVLTEQVNTQRRLSLDSVLTPIYTNKFVILTRILADRFLNSFNYKHLFIEGDKGVDTFTVFDYGFFHLIDVALLVLSLAYILKGSKNQHFFYFILGFIIVGAIPNTIRTGHPWITFRGAFAFLGLVLLMGVGSSNFYNEIKYKYKILLIPVYILMCTHFFYLYFVRYPVTHANYIGLYERIVASYIYRVNGEANMIIVPDRADATFDYIVTYNQLLTKENQSQVNQAAQTKQYIINNTVIGSGCIPEVKTAPPQTTVFVYLFKKPCEPTSFNAQEKTEIKSLIDAGSIYTIYNDKLCSKYSLGSYPSIRKNKLAVEQLSDQDFCLSFFSR